MTWVKLDESFPEHEKVRAVGPLAAWLHVSALAYCNRNLTDGFVASHIVPALADFSGIKFENKVVSTDRLVTTLLKRKLWRKARGGYRIHDYLQFQPSRKEVEKKRADVRERVNKHRRNKKQDDQEASDVKRESNGVTPDAVTLPRSGPSRKRQDLDSGVESFSNETTVPPKVNGRVAHDPKTRSGSGLAKVSAEELVAKANELGSKAKGAAG